MCLTQFTTKPCYPMSNSNLHKIKVWVLFVFEMFEMFTPMICFSMQLFSSVSEDGFHFSKCGFMA